MFCEAYESGAFGEEELAATPDGCVAALLECFFNPKPSPKPSARPRTMTTAALMLPTRSHDLVLLPTSFSPLAPNKGGEGVGDVFWSAITCNKAKPWLSASYGSPRLAFRKGRGSRKKCMLVSRKKRVVITLGAKQGDDEGIVRNFFFPCRSIPKVGSKAEVQGPGNGQVTLSFLLQGLFHSNLSSDDGKARLVEGVGEAHVPACLALPVSFLRFTPPPAP